MSNTYNYLEAVKADVIEAIKYDYTAEEIKAGFEDRDAFDEKLNDDLWTADSVTATAAEATHSTDGRPVIMCWEIWTR